MKRSVLKWCNHTPVRGVYISIKILTGQCILWYLIFCFGNCLWIFALGIKIGAAKLLSAEGNTELVNDRGMFRQSRHSSSVIHSIHSVQYSALFFSIFHGIFICCNVSPENGLLYSKSKSNIKFLFDFFFPTSYTCFFSRMALWPLCTQYSFA